MKVAIVGAGFAGVAAALAARAAGAEVTLVSGSAGASALYAGALDGSLAELPEAARPALARLLEGLGLRLADRALIATREGVVRATSGMDAALLDLRPLAGKRVALADVARDDWDAELLARAYGESSWARETSTTFHVLPLGLLERGHERRISAFDFAQAFDAPRRAQQLAEELRRHPKQDAWLLGSWLGIERPLASELSAALGAPVGEVTSPPGGPAGGRFERRSQLLLASLELTRVRQQVVSLAEDERWVTLSFAAGGELRVEAVVLACGGFAAGSLRLEGALSGAEPAGVRLAIAGLPPLLSRGEPTRPLSSLFGVDLAAQGVGVLERAGVSVTSLGGVVGRRRVLAAGDLLAPEPPTVAFALRSGLIAGAAAVRV